jgi:hypothetical protein
MSRRSTISITRRIGAALLAATVAAVVVGGCTSHAARPSSSAAPVTAVADAGPSTTHPGRKALAAALPTSADLSWLPAGTTSIRDADLVARLGFVGCSAAPHLVSGDRTSTTNIAFDRNGVRVATITFYDLDSVDDASLFMSGTRAFLRCPNQGAPVSTSLLPLSTPTACDDTLALRTRQPEASTVDVWCRVGNLVGWIRLRPHDGVAPTDAEGVATIDAVGARLGALFA